MNYFLKNPKKYKEYSLQRHIEEYKDYYTREKKQKA